MSLTEGYGGRRGLALAALAGLLAGAGGLSPARAAPPTDIVRVDDVIGAPRALFGRTIADVERALGPPLAVESGVIASYRDVALFLRVRRLHYPGLVLEALESGRLRRIRVSEPGRGLPFGLDVGSLRTEVERILGEPQQASDAALMYLYSDGYPETVHFHFLDGRVHRIEWNYGSAE